MGKQNGSTIYCILLLVFLSCSTTAQKVPLEQTGVIKISKYDSISFVSTWNRFAGAILEKDFDRIQASSLDSIHCLSLGHIWRGLMQDSWVNIDTFIHVALVENYSQHLADIIRDSSYRISARESEEWYPGLIIGQSQKFTVYRVYYIDYAPTKGSNKSKDMNYYCFDFIKLNGQFRFFGLLLAWPGIIETDPL